MICPACGNENADDAATCGLCYAVLKEETPAPAPAAEAGGAARETADVAGDTAEAEVMGDATEVVSPPHAAMGGLAGALAKVVPAGAAESPLALQLQRADELIEQGNKELIPDALSLIEQLLSLIPQEPALNHDFAVIWTHKGMYLFQLDRKEEAMHCFNLALEMNPECALALNNRGRLLEATGRLEEAIASYEMAVLAEPRRPLAWNNKGSALATLKRWQEALVCFDKVLSLDPAHPSARASREQAARQLGQAKAGAGRELTNPEAIVFYKQASDFMKEGLFAEALAAADEGLKLEPHPDGWAGKAAALKKLGRLEEALPCYDETLRLSPQDHNLWKKKAGIFLALKRFEEAAAAYDKALEIDPALPGAWNNKGAAYESRGLLIEAYLCYARSARLRPQYAPGSRNAARLKARLGPETPPEDSQDPAFSVEPVPPQDIKQLVLKVGSLLRVGLFKEALGYAEEAIKLDGGFGHACLAKGLCLVGMGRPQEALVALANAVSASPLLFDAWLHLGLTQQACGRMEEAAASIGRAAALAAPGVAGAAVPPPSTTGGGLGGKDREAVAALAARLAGDLANAGVVPTKYALVVLSEGCAQLAQGKHKEALELFNEVLTLSPYQPTAMRLAKQCEEILGGQADAPPSA